MSYVCVSACVLVCAFECWGMSDGDNYVHMCVYTYIDVLMFRRILEQRRRILEQTHTYVCGDVLACVEVCVDVYSLMQEHT